MENKNEFNISNSAQQCFNRLFTKSFKESQEDYIIALAEMALYLADEKSTKFDSILEKYNGITKRLLLQMAFSNFLEITNYRQKCNVPLDNDVQAIYSTTMNLASSGKPVMEMLFLTIPQLVRVFNDCLLYFWHPSKIYSYNAVNAIIEDNLAKRLYQIYPIAMQEHVQTLQDTYTDKEFLLHTLIECMINKGEKIIFEKGNYAIPLGYEQGIANILKEHNGSDPDKENLHEQVLEEFKEKTGITTGPDYDKILLLEMVVASYVLKNDFVIVLPEAEKKVIYQIVEKLEQNDLTIDSFSAIYDENEREIISILINDWYMLDTKGMLNDIEEFDQLKEKSKSFVKKRFPKENENK